MEIAPTSTVNAAASSLKLEDLLRVLMTELTHQNPLKPVENKDFMAQIAQFASLDSSQRLNSNISDLLLVQAMNQSVGLIGKSVTFATESGEVTGTVIAMSLTDGAPRLSIRDANGSNFTDISIGQIRLVRNPN
ncbi:MAG TPA: flagellar hook capping FlgD N-terminal domain-containing protein [Steroidobacteraceae bacterium]|nr:flagellar hook capping FlgD N-terminal domain-containing protein [Steroidobacteraceae bacterium]